MKKNDLIKLLQSITGNLEVNFLRKGFEQKINSAFILGNPNNIEEHTISLSSDNDGFK